MAQPQYPMSVEDYENIRTVIDGEKCTVFAGIVKKNTAGTRKVYFLHEGVLSNNIYDALKQQGEQVILNTSSPKPMLFCFEKQENENGHHYEVLKFAVSGFSTLTKNPAANQNIPLLSPCAAAVGNHPTSLEPLSTMDEFMLFERAQTSEFCDAEMQQTCDGLKDTFDRSLYNAYIKWFDEKFKWTATMCHKNLVRFSFEGFLARFAVEHSSLDRFMADREVVIEKDENFFRLKAAVEKCLTRIKKLCPKDVAKIFRCAEDNMISYCNSTAGSVTLEKLRAATDLYVVCLPSIRKPDGSTSLSSKIKAPCPICAWHFISDFAAVGGYDSEIYEMVIAVETPATPTRPTGYEITHVPFLHKIPPTAPGEVKG